MSIFVYFVKNRSNRVSFLVWFLTHPENTKKIECYSSKNLRQGRLRQGRRYFADWTVDGRCCPEVGPVAGSLKTGLENRVRRFGWGAGGGDVGRDLAR